MSLRSYLVTPAVIAIALASSVAAHGETLNGALAKAYQNNSSLNSARAGVRVTDEGVAIAKSGYRPSINGQLSWSYSSTHTNTAVTTISTQSSVSSVAEVSTLATTLPPGRPSGVQPKFRVYRVAPGTADQR